MSSTNDLKKWLACTRNADEELVALEEVKTDALARTVYTSPSFEESVQMTKSNSNENKMAVFNSLADKAIEKQNQIICERTERLKAIYDSVKDSKIRKYMVKYYIIGKSMPEIAIEENRDVSGIQKYISQGVKEMIANQKKK